MNKEKISGIGIELKTVEPDLLRVRQMESLIERVGNFLNSDSVSFQTNIPDEFLILPLNADQRKLLDSKLALNYAANAIGLQDQIARVPIVENFEPFIYLPDLFAREAVTVEFSDIPFHAACGEWAGKHRDFWTRVRVGERLLRLGKAFNSIGLSIHFEDGFRPVGVQEGLFKRRVEWTGAEHPDWTFDQIILEARSKTAVTPRLASHKGGAAVDITLNTLEGIPLDLGNKYPEGGALVNLDCPFITQEQWETRQIFARAAQIAGFAVYPGEDWHVSTGDNLASLNVSQNLRPSYKAVYGPIKNFDRITGEVTQAYSDTELDEIFQI